MGSGVKGKIMVLKEIVQMSLIELIPTLPIMIYIIITQKRNYQRLLKVEEKVQDSAVGANKGTLWSDKGAPFPEVIYAGLTLLMLGQDGNVVERMKECIMGFGPKGVETYYSVLNSFIDDNKEKLKGNDHFWQHIKIIKDGIY